MKEIQADVAVVGASIAGCTAARLYAQRGLSVALIERHTDPKAYKHLCGHFIQPSAVPTIERLGLAEPMEAAGAVRNAIDLWTPWGKIQHRDGDSHGYSLRRSKLDPLLRDLARSTPGVTYLGGCAVTAIDGSNVTAGGITVRAQLVVGADGRNSTVAALSGARSKTSKNERFCYLAYFNNVDIGDVPARLWAVDTDVAIAAHNDEGLTLLALFLSKEHLPSFKRDREQAFVRFFRSLPEAPQIGERASKLIGYVDYPVIDRPAIVGGCVALVGDAAHSADPLMAIGCGWAFQTAEWLVDATADALREASSISQALRRYERTRRSRLVGHQRMLAMGAAQLDPNPVQRLLMSAAARDDRVASVFHAFAAREIPVRRFLSPRTIARAAIVNMTRRSA
jgi:menaquinone-9 beta-reductase